MDIGLVELFDGSASRDLNFMADFAHYAEHVGYSSVWLPEHLLFFDDYDGSVYPYPHVPDPDDPEVTHIRTTTADGRPTVEVAPEQGLLDGLQWAVAMSSMTEHLRFGTSVLLLPLRNPRLFARELATVAELTGGRFDLGVGAGWSREEFDACGIEFSTRGKRSESVMHELFDAFRASTDPVTAAPLPAGSQPMPRLFQAGHSPAAIRRAATIATGWYPWNLTPSEFAGHLKAVTDQMEAADRQRSDIRVIAGFRFTGRPSQLPEMVQLYLDAGADAVNLSLRMDYRDYERVMFEHADALGLTSPAGPATVAVNQALAQHDEERS